MYIDEIVKNIPNVVASFYERIYITNRSANIFYNIEYNGYELKVSKQKNYEEYVEKMSVFNNEIISMIDDNDTVKKVTSTKDGLEKLITTDVVNGYKIVFITDITKRVSEDKKILLIADDSPIITKFFTKIFCDEFEVLVANDGNEAINLINQYIDKPIVGAFFDLQMPNKNGFELLEYFKENNLFSKIPVSIISGEDTADGISRATEYSGVIDMLQKPFGVEAAKAIVNKTISFSPNNK